MKLPATFNFSGIKIVDPRDIGAMPQMIEKISWPEVKKFFEKEAVRLAKKFL